jgi:predicted peptidase
MVAPDVPDRSWATDRSERAVLALVEDAVSRHRIDPTRVLVTGFSMGGRGTWYLAARHPELFTGAIVMAGSAGEADLAAVSIPVYLIHSPDDEVVPFAAAEEAYGALTARGQPVELRVLPGYSHFMMGAYVPALRLAGSWMLDRWSSDNR